MRDDCLDGFASQKITSFDVEDKHSVQFLQVLVESVNLLEADFQLEAAGTVIVEDLEYQLVYYHYRDVLSSREIKLRIITAISGVPLQSPCQKQSVK